MSAYGVNWSETVMLKATDFPNKNYKTWNRAIKNIVIKQNLLKENKIVIILMKFEKALS